MRRLVIATRNPGKIAEIRDILGTDSPGFDVVGIDDVAPGVPEPVEDGTTFERNATIKASAYADAAGALCLADDSGLEIDALAGRPGVISSHYCTDGREAGMSRPERDAANNERVLRELDGVPLPERGARFRCVMVVAEPGNPEPIALTSGAFEGRIGEPPRVPAGAHGFGYDPLFLVGPEHAHTSAELSPEQKHALSHRGKALRAMIRALAAL